MAPTARLPLIPPGAHEVTDSLAILRDGERVVFSNAGGPIFSCRNSDRMGLRLAAVNAVATPAPATLVGPRERAAEDQSCQAGVAVKRTLDRALARVGTLGEAAAGFVPTEAVPGAGVLPALPALLEQGPLEVGTDVYTVVRNGVFGLRSVLLTFAFMALRRIKTPEQLTERWATAKPSDLALLYVDGHVRPYHGRTHVRPKHHVQQRGRPMPGTKDVHVNDRRADPLCFVTATATESLLAMLDSTLLPEVRRLVGPKRRVTVAFDREGWSPKRFAHLQDEGFDVLTYRKGKQSRWRETSFEQVRGVVGGERVEYRLAERQVTLQGGLRVREIRRLTDNSHQTAVITTHEQLPLLAAAHRMFSRWRQENVFRSMRHEFALDHLCTQQVEPADPERLGTSPERTRLEGQLRAVRADRTRLVERRLDLAPGKTVRSGTQRVDEDGLDRLIQQREAEAARLSTPVATLPTYRVKRRLDFCNRLRSLLFLGGLVS